MAEQLVTKERQELPARILLQIREGDNHNNLLDFTIASFAEYLRDGVKEHDITHASVVSGLAQALKSEISKMDPHEEVDSWLAELRAWIFD